MFLVVYGQFIFNLLMFAFMVIQIFRNNSLKNQLNEVLEKQNENVLTDSAFQLMLIRLNKLESVATKKAIRKAPIRKVSK